MKKSDQSDVLKNYGEHADIKIPETVEFSYDYISKAE